MRCNRRVPLTDVAHLTCRVSFPFQLSSGHVPAAERGGAGEEGIDRPRLFFLPTQLERFAGFATRGARRCEAGQVSAAAARQEEPVDRRPRGKPTRPPAKGRGAAVGPGPGGEAAPGRGLAVSCLWAHLVSQALPGSRSPRLDLGARNAPAAPEEPGAGRGAEAEREPSPHRSPRRAAF